MTDEERKAGYRQEGSWHQHPQFKCNFCPFDSLTELTVRDHVIMRHQMQLVGEHCTQVDVPLLDADGNQIHFITRG